MEIYNNDFRLISCQIINPVVVNRYHLVSDTRLHVNGSDHKSRLFSLDGDAGDS